MPLTSANRVYKNFPNIFAENVTRHVKRRAESYRKFRNHDLVLQNLDDDEISEVCDPEKDEDGTEEGCLHTNVQSHSRLTPEMRMLKTCRFSGSMNGFPDSESETSSTPTTPSTTPRSKTSPSPRGFQVNIIESPRPLNGGNFVPAFTVSPRKPRTSPRTTCSLDNVDLWEESDSETDSQTTFDTIDGISINPSKTFDLSDLRRSRSPVACKRNKMATEVPIRKDRSKSRSSERRETRSTTKARARVNRRLKALIVNTKISKNPQTIQESSENDENEAQCNENEAQPNKNEVQSSENEARGSSSESLSEESRLLSIRGSRIAATFSNLKPKPGVFSTRTDISKLPTGTKSNFTNYKNSQATYSTKQDKKRPPVENDESLSSLTNCKVQTLQEKSATDVSTNIKDAKPHTNTTKPENYALNKLKQTPKSGSPQGSPSGGRRVKFNSFVTVRGDELNTLAFLKRPTDSARLFKNRYLSSGDNSMESTDTFAQTIH